jgi:hypothetical protein
MKQPSNMLYQLRSKTIYKSTRSILKRNYVKSDTNLNNIHHNYNLRSRSKCYLHNNIEAPIQSSISDISDISNNDIWKNFNKYDNKYNCTDTQSWVAPSHIKNYLIGDPVLDWYKQNNNVITNKFTSNNSSNLSILFELGNKFEDEVIKHLYNTYNTNIKTVMYDRRDLTRAKSEETLLYMQQGIPIISQAVLYNDSNNTFGIADLVVRSDWLNKLIHLDPISKEDETIDAPLLHKAVGSSYHYRVIDIKWTTMTLCANGTTIRNSGLFPAYKGQLAIYNAAIGNLQGYTSPEAYILAKSWKYSVKNMLYSGNNCFDRLGSINYDTFDSSYLDKTGKAIDWVRRLRMNGDTWTDNPPSVPELYPNMCNSYDTPYNKRKRDHSKDIDELTQIWMVGIQHRKYSHGNGIFKWSDPKCNSKTLGISGKNTGMIIDNILDINRNDNVLINPELVTNRLYNWHKKTDLDFYIDFESINGCFYDKTINLKNSKSENGILFMIGVGYEDSSGNWNYKTFTMDSLTIFDERKVLIEFMTFIDDIVEDHMRINNIPNRILCNPKLYHWSNAEKTMLYGASKRHDYIFNDWINNVEFVDMYNVFKSEPITVKGAVKFGLKDVAVAMYNNNMIEVTWDTNCNGGLRAMMDSIKYYKFMDEFNELESSNIKPYDVEMYNKYILLFSDITRYNEIDCKVVWAIVRYLRENHLE